MRKRSTLKSKDMANQSTHENFHTKDSNLVEPLLKVDMGSHAVPLKSQISQDHNETSLLVRVLTAVFYGVASFMIMVINKRVLTVEKFPSFQVLGLGQMTATVLVLLVAKWLQLVKFPTLTRDTWRKIWPLPIFYLGNMIFGLGGTAELSLPMLTVLRRFSILMTMIGEYYVLGVIANLSTQFSVYMMIFGAILAAANDLAFSLKGYIFVLLNDFTTAANGVVTKKKLDSKDLGKYGIMFYNSLFMLVPTLTLVIWTGELDEAINFRGWTEPNPNTGAPPAVFIVEFLLSCFFGFILMLATVVCTMYNSALTTTIVGCLKNILITYLGMIIGGDYIFSWPNFVGLTISVVGSLFYAKITFTSKSRSKPTLPTKHESSN